MTGKTYLLRADDGHGVPPLAEDPEWLRFAAKLDIGDCWEWGAALRNDGYGVFRASSPAPKAKGRLWRAHRYCYTRLVGPIGGLELDHLCRNRSCVNPDHLEPVTRAVHAARTPSNNTKAIEAIRARTHCPHGHAYDLRNTGYTPAGHRYCRACARARMYAHYYRTKASA